MSQLNAFGYAFIIILAAQGLAMIVVPDRVLAWTLAKYRLFGAHPAQPDHVTVVFYRLGGIALLAMAAFLTFKSLSE